jgi:aspartate aminotransferase-like enzyme
MKKHYLLAPGPTPVSPETLLSMATPIIHHRSPQFAEVVKTPGRSPASVSRPNRKF